MKRLLILFCITTLLLFTGCEDSTSPVPEINSDIQTDTPENQGMDSELLESGHNEAKKMVYLNAILVARNGKLVSENYYRGTDKESYHQIRSATKSFTSALTGIAIERGYIGDVNEKVMDYFPEYEDYVTDSLFYDMTIEHLLTMKSGLKNDQEISDVFSSSNWLDAIFSQQLRFSPGLMLEYSTASTHLLGVIIARTTGKSLKEFAEENLFNHLEITADQWESDPQGNYCGGSNLQLQPREMLKFGLLYQYEGQMNSIQVIPKQWITDTFNIGYKGNGTMGPLKKIGYGYQWWNGEIQGHKTYAAMGHAGQFILVVPNLNLVVVTSCFSSVDLDFAAEQERELLQIISDYIISAVR